MRRAVWVVVFLALMAGGAWLALQVRGEDHAGAAQLRVWAGGVTAQSASPAKGFEARLKTAQIGEQNWELLLSVSTLPDVPRDPFKAPATFRVSVNQWSESAAVTVDGDTAVSIPWTAFRLHGGENDITFNLESADGTAFGGWAFHSIVFEEGRVSVGRPTWLERVFD